MEAGSSVTACNEGILSIGSFVPKYAPSTIRDPLFSVINASLEIPEYGIWYCVCVPPVPPPPPPHVQRIIARNISSIETETLLPNVFLMSLPSTSFVTEKAI